MLDVQLAVAKTNKYASRESGDTLEVVERPHGGFSVVLADGQGSGRSAKSLSHLVTSKAVGMIKDGARDGAVARAAHDYLYTYRGGQVSATLVIVSLDLTTRTLVLSRNSHCPIILSRAGQEELTVLEAESNPIGLYPMTKPVVTELPVEGDTYAITYTDGVMDAGRRDSRPVDIPALFGEALAEGKKSARELADHMLEKALEADAGRPADDMTLLVLAINEAAPLDTRRIQTEIRRLEMHVPIQGPGAATRHST
ncbi:MAG TPA: PP2C family protein-serine/threonine phosphatase [Chloroflexia bacterium]|nr:PP2C family protein-serine/threonine phosphatase [Chloroflexia bacterium]